MNNTSNSTNITRSDVGETVINHVERVFSILFTTAGSIFCLTNIFLVLYFTRRNQFTKTTFIFLCHLALSDITLGLCMCVYGIAAVVPSLTTAGRIIFRFGAVCACTMSTSCIFMISLQVSKRDYRVYWFL